MNNNEPLLDIVREQAIWHINRHGFIKDEGRFEIDVNNNTKESAFYHGQFNMLARIIVHFYEKNGINIFEHSPLRKGQANTLINMFIDYINDHAPKKD